MCVNYCLFPFIAGPKIVNITNGGDHATVSMDSNITITVVISADPKPTVLWQLNGDNLTTPALK